jgi:hypothetical protein
MNPLPPESSRRLRAFLEECGYTLENLRGPLGMTEIPSRRRRSIPLLLDRTREPSPIHTLLRWFHVGVPVDSRTASAAVPRAILEDLISCGLLVPSGGDLLPCAMLVHFEGLWIASDRPLVITAPDTPDGVLWPNPTTRLLWRFSVPVPRGPVLDLGTGCGAIAFCLARAGAAVAATDLNARALTFARFNAALNEIAGVDLLQGDCFQPVAGRRFDLIISNPPFFVTPGAGSLYCENRLDLDGFCRQLIRQAPDHLQEGGFLQILFEWVELEGQSWQERIAGWLHDLDCDAWVLKGVTQDPAQYAQKRISETVDSPEGDSALFDQWMRYYGEHRVQAIHTGMLAMRKRPASRNWIWLEDYPTRMEEPFGDAILHGFHARDLLESDPEAQHLLGARPRLSPDVRLEQELNRAGGRWQPLSLRLNLPAGLPRSITVEPLVADFVGGLNGSETLAEAVAALAARVDAPYEQVERECVGTARRLMERGLLLLG